MNGSSPEDKQARIHTLYRAQQQCYENGLRPVQCTKVVVQFPLFKLEIKEEEKFIKFLGSDLEPERMEYIKFNLHQSTSLDDEFAENADNENCNQYSPRFVLRRKNPDLLKIRDEE